QEGRGALLAAAVTVPFIIGKLTGPDSLVRNPLYRPAISLSHYAHAMGLYLNVLFFQDHFFRPAKTVVLLALMLFLALWKNSRLFVLCCFFFLFSVLPFFFIPHFSVFFIYLPGAGWTLYIAPVWVNFRAKKKVPPPAALFLAVAVALA